MTNHAEHARDLAEDAGAVFCSWHPARETTLRCNRCGKPMCASCAILTPVGYRCKECVRGQQAKFETAEWYDYAIGIAIGLVSSGLAAFLLGVLLGFIRGGFIGWIIAFAAAPAIGGGIAELVRRGLRGRRGRYLAHAVVAAIVIGGLPSLLFTGLIGILYLVLAPSAAYSRLRGISIG